MRGLEEYLTVRQPHGFWIEEVKGILKTNPVTGKRYMDEVASAVANKGYSIRVLVLNHNTWIKLARERVFLLGWHQHSGGKHAADWAAAAVLRVTRIREAAGQSVDPWSIIGKGIIHYALQDNPTALTHMFLMPYSCSDPFLFACFI